MISQEELEMLVMALNRVSTTPMEQVALQMILNKLAAAVNPATAEEGEECPGT